MIAAVISDFGFLGLKLQDVFEVKVMDAILNGKPEDVGVVVAFHLFSVGKGGRGAWIGKRE